MAFAGIAVLTAGVIGAVLIPILASHYRGAEETYLEAAAERAVRDLSSLSWKKESAELGGAVDTLALVTQARVRVIDSAGQLVADSGSPWTVQQSQATQPLPDPLGGGLFGGGSAVSGAERSVEVIERPVQRNGRLLGSVELSEAPAYAQAALLNATKAWVLAGLLGVVLAALVGWLVASRLSRPLRSLTEAADRMAGGDLGARTRVDRGDEVGRLAASFDSMATRVEETVTSLRRFVADAAHEIGTPLTALQADIEIARTHPQTRTRARFLEQAAEQVRRLEHLTTSLLGLSRLEAGDTARGPRPLDLTELARQAADAFASRADQAAIDLVLDLPDSELWVSGHADKLTTAVANLLDNALKFTPRGGRVTLGLRRTDNRALLWVADTGIGIASEELDKLFQRFHRGRNAYPYPGSGLGLAIVQAVAELHEGTVTVTSGVHGSHFEIVLPAAPIR